MIREEYGESFIWGFHCKRGIDSLIMDGMAQGGNTEYGMPSLRGVKCLKTGVNSMVIFE